MHANPCDCGKSVEGRSERHGDGTITFHTFAGCPRVKECEHTKGITGQSDVAAVIGPDGRCIECAKKGRKA